MAISYAGLFRLMEEQHIKKADLRGELGFNPKTVDSLVKNKSVTVDTLCKLCEVLHCQIGDLVEYVQEEK